MASTITDKAKGELLTQAVLSSTYRLLLVSNNPTTSAAQGSTFVSGITGNELSGTGYVRQTITGVTVTVDTSGHRAILSFTNPATYTGINAGTIAGAWLYRRVGGSDVDASDILIAFLDCTDLVTNGGDVTLSFDAVNGALTLS